MAIDTHVRLVKQGVDALAKSAKERLGLLDLAAAEFRGFDLRGAILTGTIFFNADLSDTDLSSAYLKGANLMQANLAGANLTNALMTGANLRDANLTGAHLAGADLSGDDLGEANLINTNLLDADLTTTNLDGVVVETENWFEELKDRGVAPKDIDELEAQWRVVPAGRLKCLHAEAVCQLEPPIRQPTIPEEFAASLFQIRGKKHRKKIKRRGR